MKRKIFLQTCSTEMIIDWKDPVQVKRYLNQKRKELYSKRREVEKEITRETRRRFPEVYRARYFLYNAIKLGRVKKRDCEVCGSSFKVEAHHEDYGKPFGVKWLCRLHHARLHRDVRKK